MDVIRINLVVGWVSMVLGAFTGAIIGLRFHQEHWLGGYASLRRRMLRLGHISHFGLGILNVLFALSLAAAPVSEAYARAGSVGFTVAAIAMPTCCFLTAWREPFRVLFPIPVLAVFCGIGGLLAGWLLT